MRLVLLLLAFFIITNSCNKKNIAGSVVEIYSLKTVQFVTNKCQVDGSRSMIEDTPLVTNHDIVEYAKTNYEFKLTDEGIQKLQVLRARNAFAVTVDKQVIYYGIYMPDYLSSSCDHSITMGQIWSSDNKIIMRLGYPGQLQGVTIDDKRNDPTLLAALANQNKLR